MSIRFAAAGTGESAAVTRVLRAPRPAMPANDTDNGIGQDFLLRSALRHFAQHGLGALDAARNAALEAHAAGASEEREHWLAVCRKFDRRAARALTRKLND